MPTTAVGFRLGHDETGRQQTLIVTHNGLRHTAHGLYGTRGTVCRPSPPFGQNPVHAQIARMRQAHASLLRRGFTRLLIPPACVHLEVDEPPLADHPYGPDAPRPHRALVEAFVGAAPTGPRGLEEAITDFYMAIGVPHRPSTSGYTLAPASTPAHLVRPYRQLAAGERIECGRGEPAGYTVTPEEVRLRVGSAEHRLTPEQVVQMQADLTALLYLQRARREAHRGT
ncbi:hypothetical protein JW613_31240 [Streptomyces smyrnaeus]|uniref:Uncharacterized protein n=1 Tax=Streptomyces smyrnaeus TaxID=1387713 RepID=A0ABS3Y6F5_9ACTN|nr:hypothetical protein [Streptomyces smyrnaeus]MBO8202717.1 hypothetical protein [Streptomyces smyrnaeus]